MGNLPRKGERVVFVELSKDGTPYQVFTRTPGGRVRQYDIEHSTAEGRYLMEESGGGMVVLAFPFARHWMRSDFHGPIRSGLAPDRNNQVQDDYQVPVRNGSPFRIADLAGNVEVVDRLLYCPTCNDWFEAPDYGPGPCDHLTYCEPCGVWDGHDGQRCKHGKPAARPDQPALFDPEEDD